MSWGQSFESSISEPLQQLELPFVQLLLGCRVLYLNYLIKSLQYYHRANILFFYFVCEETESEKFIHLPQATQSIRVKEGIQTQVFWLCRMYAISLLTGLLSSEKQNLQVGLDLQFSVYKASHLTPWDGASVWNRGYPVICPLWPKILKCTKRGALLLISTSNYLRITHVVWKT